MDTTARNQCQPARNRQTARALDHNGFHRLDAHSRPGGKQHRGQQDGGHTFHSLVAVGVFLVGLAVRHRHPGHHNQGAEHIRSRVNPVGNHGSGMRGHAREQLKRGQHKIDRYADPRHIHGSLPSASNFPFPSN